MKKELIVEQGLQGVTYSKGYAVLESKGIAVVMISPNNLHFSKEHITKLHSFATDNFSNHLVLICDGLAIHNYLAKGWLEPEANSIIGLKKNNLTNKCEDSGFTSFYDWSLKGSSSFQKSYSDVKHTYLQNESFQQSIDELASSFLKGSSIPEKRPMHPETALAHSKEYLLEELAVLDSLPKTHQLHQGYTFLYHNPFSVFEEYFSHRYKDKSSKVGQLVVK